MPLSLPGPSSLIGAAGKGIDALEQAVSLVPRLNVIVTEVENILLRVQTVLDNLEVTQRRADAAIDQTAAVVARAGDLTTRAGPLLDQLEQFEPTLLRLQPILERLADTTDPDEVAAIVAVVDLLPERVEKLHTDIVPILDTFGTVAPDLRDLLDVSMLSVARSRRGPPPAPPQELIPLPVDGCVPPAVSPTPPGSLPRAAVDALAQQVAGVDLLDVSKDTDGVIVERDAASLSPVLDDACQAQDRGGAGPSGRDPRRGGRDPPPSPARKFPSLILAALRRSQWRRRRSNS